MTAAIGVTEDRLEAILAGQFADPSEVGQLAREVRYSRDSAREKRHALLNWLNPFALVIDTLRMLVVTREIDLSAEPLLLRQLEVCHRQLAEMDRTG